MGTFSTLILGATSIFTLYHLWMMYCNGKACRQRRHLIHFLNDAVDDPNWSETEIYNALLEFNDKSYNRHVKYLMIFRDPFQLYPKTMLLFRLYNKTN